MQQFKLPEIHGITPTLQNIIYFSCDETYYNDFGIPLIKSIISQVSDIGVHCHIIKKNLDFQPTLFERTTYTWELIDDTFLSSIPLSQSPTTGKYNKEKTAEVVYYSCARFMQLDKIFSKHHRVLQIDCDSILWQSFPLADFLEVTNEVRAMRKPKSPEKLIASAISFGNGIEGHRFRKHFATELYTAFSTNAYWFIDQDVMQKVFKFPFQSIPIFWNTWSFKKRAGYFRTAKGNKKNNDTFNNKRKYWLEFKV